MKWGNLNCPAMARNPLLLPQISSLTSLYECGSHFGGGEKSAAISLIPPRGPRPQPVDGNVRSIQPRGGRTIFPNHTLLPSIGKLCTLKMRPALICYALLFRQNIKINQGRNDYREWLVVIQVRKSLALNANLPKQTNWQQNSQKIWT